MKRLFFSVFDVNSAIEKKGRSLLNVFQFKQAFAAAFDNQRLHNWLIAGATSSSPDFSWEFFESLINELETTTQESLIPDYFEPFHAVLTHLDVFKQSRYNGRSVLVLPKSSRFQGEHLIQELESKWLDQTLSRWSMEFPVFSKFLQSLDLEDLKMALKKKPKLPYFLNPDHPIVVELQNTISKKPKLLLHICCGPDAAGVIEQLKKDYDLHCFWYDPNIQPVEEYNKRLDAFIQVANIENVSYTVGEYDVDNFEKNIKGLEFSPEKGAKCSVCYDMRLERSAQEASRKGFDLYTTTLAISPHKVQQKLKNFGKLFEKKYGVPYLARNFLKYDGFKNSVEYTKEHNIFRQDYCGCYYSLWEGGKEAQSKAKEWGYMPPKELQNNLNCHKTSNTFVG